EELKDILPELQMLTKASGDKPSVRYFDGKEGLRAIRQEIIMHAHSGDTVYNFTPADHLRGVFANNEDTHYRQRISKGIHAKTLFTTKADKTKKEWLSTMSDQKTEIRFVAPESFPVPAGLTIYRDRIAMGSYTGKLFGVVIESEQIANMMIALFELAWESAKKP
ncbi:MAG: hypothetical protein ABIP54_03995, partial [Candidatus Andersenbacteria bacterium]